MPENSVTLSGRNNQNEPRTVYLDDVEIGSVEPYISTCLEHLWVARDLKGVEHGRWWTKDWYAADALTRTPRDPEHVGLTPLAGTADLEWNARLDAERVTLELRTRSTRKIDGGRRPIEESPLFGGTAQGDLF